MNGDLASLVAITSHLVLAGVFGLAGVAKVARPGGADALARALTGSSRATRRQLVRGLGSFEIVIALLLIAGFAPLLALTVANATLEVFTAVWLRLRKLGYDGACGCFGGVEERSEGNGVVFRNAALVGLGLMGTVGHAFGGQGMATLLEAPTREIATAAAIGIVAVFAYSFSAELARLTGLGRVRWHRRRQELGSRPTDG